MLTPPLYGITVAQVTYYFRSFPNDPIHVKLVVGILFLLDTAHIICFLQSAYEWFITKLLAPILPILFCIAVVLTLVRSKIIHLCVSFRSTAIPELTAYRSGIVQSVDTLKNETPDVTQTSGSFKISGKFELSSSLVCDVLIAGAMTYFLRKSGGNIPIRRTSEVVNSMIIYSISVGFFTSVATALNLALWVALPENFTFIIFHLILSKLYVNSLLVMLNSRVKLRRHFYTDEMITLDLSA
ncbi:hypothetical protein C8R46DRAFT_1255968 [Mycena filopes]|nr:hypothetical protein C8R46DRAFT_1255968 [Mycena filopes]